ncbi:MAG: DMT family transporter [Clostridia bacterium]|nr:DMT family transporter [Clostridia bacterium]MBN2882201.1 DMT family transporter [Clostridia bacterium]
MEKIKKAAPYLSGLAFASIFGFSFLITKNTLGRMEVFQLLGIRFGIAGILFEFLRLTKVVKVKLSGRMFREILPVAILQPILYFIFEIYGVRNSETGEAGLMIGMIPVAVAIASWIFLKEKLNLKQIIFMILSISGVSLIGFSQMNGGAGSTRPVGYLLLAGAVVSAAFYNLLSRKSSMKYRPVEITYIMMITGAIIFNAIGIIDSMIKGYEYFSPLLDFSVMASMLYLGVLSSTIAFFCVNFTLSRIPAVQSSIFANLVTVISIGAGVVFLSESFTILKGIGSVLIIAGVLGTNYFQTKKLGKTDDYTSNDY